MKTFVYKTLFIFVCIFILFQLTIGAKIKQLNKELTELKSKENIEIIKNKLRDELRNAISKENYLSPDDAKLINEFNEKNIFLEFPISCDLTKTKNELFEYLLNKKIDVKNYYYKNCSEEKIYNSYNSICLNSKSISENIIMLPVHEKITKDYQQKIVDIIKSFYNK